MVSAEWTEAESRYSFPQEHRARRKHADAPTWKSEWNTSPDVLTGAQEKTPPAEVLSSTAKLELDTPEEDTILRAQRVYKIREARERYINGSHAGQARPCVTIKNIQTDPLREIPVLNLIWLLLIADGSPIVAWVGRPQALAGFCVDADGVH